MCLTFSRFLSIQLKVAPPNSQRMTNKVSGKSSDFSLFHIRSLGFIPLKNLAPFPLFCLQLMFSVLVFFFLYVCFLFDVIREFHSLSPRGQVDFCRFFSWWRWRMKAFGARIWRWKLTWSTDIVQNLKRNMECSRSSVPEHQMSLNSAVKFSLGNLKNPKHSKHHTKTCTVCGYDLGYKSEELVAFILGNQE